MKEAGQSADLGIGRISHAQMVLALNPQQQLHGRNAALVAEHKPFIGKALDEVERGLKELAHAVRHASFGVVFEPIYGSEGELEGYTRLDHGPSLAAAAHAYIQIDLSPSEPDNATVRCIGAVGVLDIDTIQLAIEVNRRKAILKQALCRLGPHTYRAKACIDGETVVRRLPVAVYILRQLRGSALNRLAAYRQIPLVPTPANTQRPPTPHTISYSEQWVRSQPRATLDQLIDLARAANRLERVELLRATGIPGNEFLYEAKRHYLRMRTNYTTEATPLSKVHSAMAELPFLFFRGGAVSRWPRITPPRPRDGSLPRARKGSALEDVPVPGAPEHFRRKDPLAREYAKRITP